MLRFNATKLVVGGTAAWVAGSANWVCDGRAPGAVVAAWGVAVVVGVWYGGWSLVRRAVRVPA